MFFNYIGFSFIVGIVTLFIFGTLEFLHIPAGNIVDWIIGVASFWWLMAIVTIPWNVYFDAKEVISEAAISKNKGIAIDSQQIDYAKQVRRWSILIAIALHLLSAIGLYYLAAAGISTVGYFSSAATLLLTGLRPAIRFYQYLAYRLNTIRQEIKYPREDAIELRNKFNILEVEVGNLKEQLDPQLPNSLTAIQQREWQEIRNELAHLRALLERLEATNRVEHEKLAKEAQNAIAQLTEDGQVLNHVREIIRFFKSA
jgi:hypothetical protein